MSESFADSIKEALEVIKYFIINNPALGMRIAMSLLSQIYPAEVLSRTSDSLMIQPRFQLITII